MRERIMRRLLSDMTQMSSLTQGARRLTRHGNVYTVGYFARLFLKSYVFDSPDLGGWDHVAYT